MKKPVSFAELRTMSLERREHELSRVIAQTRQPPNGEISAIEKKLRYFEQRYACSSSEMAEKVTSGGAPEEPDIAAWMMMIDLRDQVAGGGSAPAR